jgi:hypothetical protein
MSTPLIGRNARLVKDGQPIGYCKNISVKATQEMIKDYSMDSNDPAVSGPGKRTFTWSAERLFTDKTYLQLLLDGTQFDLVFAPDGSPLNASLYETWNDCTVLSCERKAGETGAVLENVSGESQSVTFPD